jgi:hypothetical protein
MSLRDAVSWAIALSCRLDYPHATGELRVTTPNGTRVRLKNGRKDAPCRLVTVLRRVANEPI